MTGANVRRTLQPELRSWLYARCNGFLDRPGPELLAYAATQCVGIVEQGGNNQGHFVRLFQSTIGPPMGEPWCMAFVQSLVAFVEELCGPSLLPATEHCLSALNSAPKGLEVFPPKQGDLIIWRQGHGPAGHVGIIMAVTATGYRTIEGNTGNGHGVLREGDGVYARTREKNPPGTMKIAGFLRPFGYQEREESSSNTESNSSG